MSFMPPTDSMFLLAESRDQPMHVGGLQLFVPPEDAGPDYVSETVASFRDLGEVSPLFRKRPAEPVGTLGNTWWAADETIDFDYHVRHSAVPRPGRIRELLQLTSRWHGSLLDRHRPLWEAHVVEGLADGRIAVYTKVHHSMLDGVSALRLIQKTLSADPDARDCIPPWGVMPHGGGGSKRGLDPMGLLRTGAGALGDIAGLVPASLRIGSQVLRDGDVTLPRAPKTILNGPVGGSRRFAAQSWEIERIQRVAKSSATTLNDVVLAMVSGALRQYLLEQHALPDDPMTAMVPVSLSLRAGSAEDDAEPGNATGAIVVNLATDREQGASRLEEIAYSSRQAKKIMGDLTPTQILAFSALQVLPLALGPVPGFVKYTHPPFNVIVSNVPGPKEPMYFNGSRLDGLYPVSIVLDGQALNITLTSRDKYLDFGLIGCRASVPHLQRLLLHLESSLAELEQSWG
ncbi:wax ester/triacylglycerol synthase family O-acyltransferase [Aeromicrobium sp. SMF47]|uniref:Diacylglycerol O-acyltransferase n=1 Tax=Aeromicrobium yanjiei TaxID=2662028 RepID=A0A5Q2MHM2_9ACTN|nr:wax ester/triacylglycerol synthase family O-acyltransferase [Aeromicrobium yanjiei]MRJ74971.1 wax ester/triacylglycerol synthase family O-acyltransferase [Aeromicrobium yanjiei]QGG40536.1 wax ester/triacylglycerol synthase family O-acyltransferase [Aeromicrobium yanjiei]